MTPNSADYEALAQHLAHNGELAALRREQGKHPLSDIAGESSDVEESMRRVLREFAG